LTDPEVIAKYCPELALDKLEILEGFDENGEPKMRKAKTAITLEMLLTHSAGRSGDDLTIQDHTDQIYFQACVTPGTTLLSLKNGER
jgi:CubicO group peptidase (beta-lactamase class C family)